MCKHPKFRETCFETHKYRTAAFDAFVKHSINKYNTIVAAEMWDQYVNVCASITAFVTAFPERLQEYQ